MSVFTQDHSNRVASSHDQIVEIVRKHYIKGKPWRWKMFAAVILEQHGLSFDEIASVIDRHRCHVWRQSEITKREIARACGGTIAQR